MEELWRKTSTILWQNPLVWLPVLLADFLGSLLNLGQAALLAQLVRYFTNYRSALSGQVTHNRIDAATAHRVSLISVPLVWSTYLLRVLLYAVALFVIAELVKHFHSRVNASWEQIRSYVSSRKLGLLGLGLRGLALYAAAALLTAAVSGALLSHKQTAVLRSPWFHVALALLVIFATTALLPGPTLRALTGSVVSERRVRLAQLFGLLTGLTSLVLTFFMSQSAAFVLSAPSARQIILEMLASLVTSVPYVPLFVALGLLAKESREDGEGTPLHSLTP